MMRGLHTLILAGGLLVAGAALAKDKSPRVNPQGEAELAKLLKGRVPGKPISCISLRDIQDTQVIDGTAIVYHIGSQLYVNRPEIGRESLDDDDILVTKTWTSQLCRIDTVRLIDRGSRFERGFVGLGDFVPYSRVQK